MKEIYEFHLIRGHYRRERTLGKLFTPDDELFCYVLEDTIRGCGIKDKGNTAIPATECDDNYRMKVMLSGRYGEAVTVFTHLEDGVPILEYGGISFKYIRCHGGNTEKDTEGCLLVNRNWDIPNMTANGSMMKELTDKVKKLELAGFDVRLKITNLNQVA